MKTREFVGKLENKKGRREKEDWKEMRQIERQRGFRWDRRYRIEKTGSYPSTIYVKCSTVDR